MGMKTPEEAVASLLYVCFIVNMEYPKVLWNKTLSKVFATVWTFTFIKNVVTFYIINVPQSRSNSKFFSLVPKNFLIIRSYRSYSFFCKYSPQQNCRFEIQIKITWKAGSQTRGHSETTGTLQSFCSVLRIRIRTDLHHFAGSRPLVIELITRTNCCKHI